MPHTGLAFDPYFERHDTGAGHPESAERYRVLSRRVETLCADSQIERVPVGRSATHSELCLCHDPYYIDHVKMDAEHFAESLRTGDTAICEDSFDVACVAAGTCLEMVDRVLSGGLRNGFCAVRPPGHHANKFRGMGFCIFNNAALAARYAQQQHGLERVAIIDWDVHHGNGTQDIFYEDPSVLFCSVHEWPSYTHTGTTEEQGAGDGIGTTVNCPLGHGASGVDVRQAFAGKLAPALRSFEPQLIMISAGFDAHVEDPMASFELTDADFGALTRDVMQIAEDSASGRIVSVLEGGYDPTALAAAAACHIETLATA